MFTKKSFITLLFLSICLIITAQTPAFSQSTPINLEPMYGKAKKTPQQLDADKKFIEESIKLAGSREAAAKFTAARGWQHLKKREIEIAMQRFNQAWLLDPNFYGTYWGFGVIQGNKGNLKECIEFLKKANQLSPSTNVRLVSDLAHAEKLLKDQQEKASKSK